MMKESWAGQAIPPNGWAGPGLHTGHHVLTSCMSLLVEQQDFL